MRFSKSSTNVLAIVGAILLATSVCLALSIESDPVKVTHRNSGPRYDIDDDVERAKLTPVPEEAQKPPAPQGEDGPPSSGDQEPAVGHVSIRRIFLVPMMPPPKRYWQENGAESSEQPAMPGPRPAHDSDAIGQPGMFAKPFWPFLTPARPAHSHHLFGADEPSRSPSAVSRPSGQDQDKAASGAEREEDQAPLAPPMFDPIQMMVDMMHQAINSQLIPVKPNLTDLNKEASTPKSGSESPDQASQERPQMPGEFQLTNSNRPNQPKSQNETREDIVEIEGKKYLRKTVINRHVGDNIFFMTKRLIFVPLNETESADEKPATPTTTTVSSTSADKIDSPTTTVSSAPSEATTTTMTTTQASNESPADNEKSTDSKPIEKNAPTTTTTTASSPTMAASEPTTTTTGPESSVSTSAAESVEATTTKDKSSWLERVSDVVDKAAERLTESVRSKPEPSKPTEKPASSS